MNIGLSVPFACVGSGDPVRVLRLYTTNTLDVLLKHLLLRRMYNLQLPILLCYAQALRSETSYCYCDHVTLSACVRVCVSVCHTVLCGALYTACVDASRTVFWDQDNHPKHTIRNGWRGSTEKAKCSISYRRKLSPRNEVPQFDGWGSKKQRNNS